MSTFDPEAILRVLTLHEVRFVLVGGYAAQLHGASRPTRDVDITPDTDRRNLGQLAQALKELDARIRTDAEREGLPFRTSADALTGLRMLNLVTKYGDLDITVEPSGVGGYQAWLGGSRVRSVGTVSVRVAGLRDIITSKEAASRTKDVVALPELLRLIAELDE